MDPKDKEWKKLMEQVFPRFEHKNPEAFVTRVMARIESESREKTNSWFPYKWGIPALVATSLAVASFFVSPTPEPDCSTGSLLLRGDACDHVAFNDELPATTDLLAFALEEDQP